ncbi:TetR/AcrR family transcriptional regulator [Microlunatus elymi]|uniref:TetR/AcrR family transcriptional regulator n=1 Tax=Microlunatus elymi TaxID=2596828 RepID=UPI001AEF3E3A|nr:TetR family transcriptional regulator [Microlunatus elymi]
MDSLRERKKAATRQRISDIATGLFAERGFDNVTVNEIAAAAEVSKVTVFNYFPRKEDIFFDRIPQAAELITAAVRDRGAGVTPLAALRGLVLELAEQRHPLGGVREPYAHFWRLVQDSPALRARVREVVDEWEILLAGLLAEHSDDPHPRLTAALAVAGYRIGYLAAVERTLAGDSADQITADLVSAINAAFDILERGLGS